MRLIDADALEPSEVYMNYGFTRIVYMDDIDEMPTIDAVEVVRCKDCKYSKYKQGELRCYIWSISSKTKEDGYCFCGAKMDEEEL